MQPSKMSTGGTAEPIEATAILEKIAEETARIGARYMPTLTVKQFTERESQLKELKAMLVEGTDYGTIPGTPKPTLYQAGAQKICAFFGYAPSYTVEEIEDWDGSRHGGEPLFYYKYTCTLMKDGKPVGQGTGSCNSWESKYRYRWSSDAPANVEGVVTRDGTISEPQFAVTKAETSGPYGKPAQYWDRFKEAVKDGTAKKGTREKKGGGTMDTWEIGGKLYRIPNEGFPDIINTVQKIAQKRAYVGACLSATGASQYFTQDIEDMPADAIGKSDAPAPGSGSQKKAEPEKAADKQVDDDPALVQWLDKIMKCRSKEARQEVFADLVDAIKQASDNATGSAAWAVAVQPKDGHPPSPTDVVRSLYEAFLAVAEKKMDVPREEPA
jgi:hypothetical protein